MLIELDVYSGRPNPHWELDETHSQALLQLQNRLKVSSRAPVEPPGLGYRGFWYSSADSRVHAYHGFVTVADTVMADPSFSIETYLLDQLPGAFAGARERIQLQIAGWQKNNER